MSRPASRAHALDAVTLDAELEKLLLSRAQGVTWYLGTRLSGLVQPELKALLRAALWYLSSFSGNEAATAGQALLGLHQAAGSAGVGGLPSGPALELVGPRRTRPSTPRASALTAMGAAASALPHRPRAASRSRIILYGVLVVLVPWAWTRLSQLITDSQRFDGARWARWLRRTEGAVALASLFVTLRFMRSGGSPTLPMALAGIQLMHTLPQPPRRPIFDFMEQQLVWRAIADLMIAFRALVHASGLADAHAAVTLVDTTAQPTPTPAAAMSPISSTPAAGAAEGGSGARAAVLTAMATTRHAVHTLGHRVGLLPSPTPDIGTGSADVAEEGDEAKKSCVFCGACPPHTPRTAPCGHACCYFCVARARMMSDRAACPRCRRPLLGD